MSNTLLDIASYAVRASGMAIVIMFGAFFAISPLISTKPSGVVSILGAWTVASALLSWPRLPNAWKKDPPTQRQLEYAASLGIVVPADISKGDLSQLISHVTGR